MTNNNFNCTNGYTQVCRPTPWLLYVQNLRNNGFTHTHRNLPADKYMWGSYSHDKQ